MTSPESTQEFDVHGKGPVYYSCRTTYVMGFEGTTISYFRDGAMYSLDPEKKAGTLATRTSSSLIADNVLLMDSVFSALWGRAEDENYTVEDRELDGRTCRAEVYPASAAHPSEEVFLFDEAGDLVCYIQTNDVLGELVYTIHSIDGTVDEELLELDLSEYELSDWT